MRSTAMMIVLWALSCLASAAGAAAPDEAARRRLEHFFDRVQPLLQQKCVSCHGPDKQKENLRLDSRAAALKGGNAGPALRPGQPEESLLIKAVMQASKDLQMPPKEKLKADDVAALRQWVKDGAVWPRAVAVLFEDEESMVAALSKGDGAVRLESDHFSGSKALLIGRQREAERIAGWNFRIAEQPKAGEYRYIRFAWKKRSSAGQPANAAGGVMLELANQGKWRTEKEKKAAWTAGRNSTGWDAHEVAKEAPAEWTVVTRDLWADRGDWNDFVVTGMTITSIDGGEVLIDSILLGDSLDSLDAYRAENLDKSNRVVRATKPATPPQPAARIGDAWTDEANPIRQIWKGQRLDLWSLRKPTRAELPKVKNEAWVRTPVDRFILAELEKQGLALSPQADKRTLIRRLYFDLIGLPPPPQAVRKFVADQAPDAYERLVEELLASPRYGEKWARHWLDVARYADTHGHERDEFRPNAWRYRDYVIRSFNADKPYDQFIREQLAGDEMLSGPPTSAAEADKLIATGFLRAGLWDSTASIFQEDAKLRNEILGDMVNTTGSAFLGLTMSCANCHDHKYDPISQADHFRFRAFFAGYKFRDDLPVESAAMQAQIDQHNAAIDAETKKFSDESEAIRKGGEDRVTVARKAKFPPEILALLKAEEKSRDEETKKKLKPFLDQLKVDAKDLAAALSEPEKARREELKKAMESLKAKRRSHSVAPVVVEDKAPPTHVLYQGDVHEPREVVAAGILSVFDPNAAAVATPQAAGSGGRRTALANWIASADNPFTARVMVNRLWQHHFAAPLFGNPNDLGYAGPSPTHPALLDWLATEFAARGWSIKQLHRTMVLSATYRQASVETSAKKAIDPENKLYWRQNVQRLSAELVRDAMLASSGALLADDAGGAGGPPRWPPVPKELLDAQPSILEAKDDQGAKDRLQGWYGDPLEKTFVRSVYLVQKRCLPLPMLQVFDQPDASVSCGRRDVTTVAPQALALLNNEFTTRMAETLADHVIKEAGDDAAKRIEQALWLTLARSPDVVEMKLGLDLLARHEKQHVKARDAKRAALVDWCRALMNVNEFVYVD